MAQQHMSFFRSFVTSSVVCVLPESSMDICISLCFLVQIRRCFGWRRTWAAPQGAHSHGALKSAASCGVAAPCGPRHDVRILLYLRRKKYIISHLESHVIARATFILLIKNHGGTKVAHSGRREGRLRQTSGVSFLGSLLCLKSTQTYCKLFYSCAEFAIVGMLPLQSEEGLLRGRLACTAVASWS